MLKVTASAKERLKEALQRQTTHPKAAIRIILSSSTPNQLDFALDKEREGDQVVKSEDGMKLLLVEPDLASVLSEMVIDYQETPQGRGLALSKVAHAI